MSLFKKIKVSCALSSILLLFSCSDDFINSPTGSTQENNSSAVAKYIAAPQQVTASHGGVKKIQLQWKSVSGASMYKIYSSDSPFAEFQQVGEAKGEVTSISISEDSGKNKYFKIKAVNYSKVESIYSDVALGSTLATPVITSVEMGSEGTTATVKWWMENCSPGTYSPGLLYEISAYNEDRTTLAGSASAAGTDLSATISNLSPKTNYFFKVEAFLNSDQTSIEESDMVDAETARKLIPNPVENLQISQGISETEVKISFTLPDFCDYSAGKGTYERHPLYFKILRKEKNSNDSAYETLVSYLGTMIEESTDDKIKINCSTNESSSEFVTVEKTEAPEAETNSAYEEYISLSKVTYTDKTVARGKQYTYRIQSYVDDTKKTISSDESVAEDDGWLIGVGEIRITGNYTLGTENKYTDINFEIYSAFENFGKDYKYILKIEKFDIEENPNGSETKIFNSIADLNSHRENFNDLKAHEGYYKYSLYICPTDAVTTDSAYTFTNAPGKYIVTDDAGRVPTIEEFNVADGFADKFNLSWKYNDSYIYTIKWNSILENGSTGEEESLELTESDLTGAENATTFTFSHAANSGERRIYKLAASNGLSREADAENKPENSIFETLGTAKIIPATKEYDSISFSWDKVQKADDYEIHAYYSGETSELAESYEHTISGNTYSCKIEKPAGYDDATKSGKDVVVKVIAKNAETNSLTEKTEKTATLGPAATDAKVLGTQNDISVVWNKVDGASAYAICRAIYKDGSASEIEKIDTILVDAVENAVKVSGENVNSSNAKRADISSTSSTFTLKDCYAEVTDAESAQTNYQINQSKISWGLPFGYFVVPVKNESDFSFNLDDSKKITMEGSKVAYSNISDVKGATYGYGLNVKASKATSANAVTVSWTKPYEADSKSAALYRKSEGENTWKFLSTITSGVSSYSYTVDRETTPYEYAVLYNGTNSNGEVFCKSFVDSLKENKDSISTTEQANKGYALTLTSVQANTNNGFTESVSWTPYNFSEKTIGPDYYELQVGNYNKKNVWSTIAKITPDVAQGDLGKTAVIQNGDKNKISLTSDNYSATVTPTFDSDNCSTGVLQVLRDAKHYYRLVAVRTFKDATETDVTINSYSSEAYAYREITSEEFIKIASICINDGLYQVGKLDFENESHNGGNGGTVIGKHEATFQVGKKYSITFNDYSPLLKTPNGNNVFIAKINGQLIGYRNSDVAGSYPVSFDEKEITVSALDSNLPSSYSGIVKFKISKKENAEISSNNTVIRITTNEQRRKWIPWQFNEDNNWYHESSSYDWWED